MISEITDSANQKGWVLFDGNCGFCAKLARRCAPWLHRHRFARGRYCVAGRCSAGPPSRRRGAQWLGWFPALAMLMVAAECGQGLEPWVRMWVIALALYFAAKWITILDLLRPADDTSALRGPHPIHRARLLAYALFWPGMDAPTFCLAQAPPRPRLREWALAAFKALTGAWLGWVGVRLIGPSRPLLQGWIGMIGVVLFLHFGLFHLLSLFWRERGCNAPPIMQSPGTCTSLSRFWGGRWNAAFSGLMREQVFKPLAKRFGTGRALLAVFLVSGLVHDLVISVPARGGYGLPTLYFVIQGLGVLVERTDVGRRVGLGSGWRGWVFVLLVTGAPAFWLFHPVFIRNVILPMFRAFGAP